MEHCLAERRGQTLIVTLNRPDRLNALHSAAHFELSGIFDEFERDQSLRAAIITGTGARAFCSGNDLKVQAAGEALERPRSGFGGLSNRLTRTKPVIAAVNGVAAGGGAEIVNACDLAVAEEHATFSWPEVRVGLVPLGAIHQLVRTIGRKDACDLLLTGRAVTAGEALRMGLINEVVPAGMGLARALELASLIAKGSPVAVSATLEIMTQSAASPSLVDAIATDYDAMARLRRSADYVEGSLAFSEKRPPKWG